MAKKKSPKKKVAKRTSATKKSAKKTASGKRGSKKAVRKTAVARRPAGAIAPRGRKQARRAGAAPRVRVEVIERTTFEAEVLESAVGRVEALEEKLQALERLEAALLARRTHTSADDDEINPNLNAIRNAKRAVEAEIAAGKTTVLAAPSEADLAALRNAVRDAENVIAQNAAVNQLVKAATALIRTLKA